MISHSVSTFALKTTVLDIVISVTADMNVIRKADTLLAHPPATAEDVVLSILRLAPVLDLVCSLLVP